MTRRLTLAREALAELTPDELSAVVGGSSDCFKTLTQKLGCEGTYQCPTWTC